MLLQMERASVTLPRGGRMVPIVDSLDLSIGQGEMLTLVGESGSGKTMVALAVARLLPPGAVLGGRITLAAQDLTALKAPAMRSVRGRMLGMVFQNPLAALNPSHTVGRQIGEPFRIHTGAGTAATRRRVLELLGEVGIADAGARIDDYPHQFSGGMRQRVMIAAALACSPRLLIADEPTTGLDTIIARQIMALIGRLRREHRMGVLFITHDLSAIEDQTDQVQVLYAGRTVERGPAGAFFAGPRHPYSQALLGAIPRIGQARLACIPGTLPEPEQRPAGCRFAPRCEARHEDCTIAYPPETGGTSRAACLYPRDAPAAMPADAARRHLPARVPLRGPAGLPGAALLALDGVGVRYGGRGGVFAARLPAPALRDISFALARGECLGIVGESGSGKSTLGRAVLQMVAYEGGIALDGQAFAGLSRTALRRARRRIQVVFQDPRDSLNPRMSIAQSIAEPLLLAGMGGAAARRRQVDALLERVGLSARLGNLRPDAVSGGQAQRVAIARALAAGPDVIVFDEPTSALDVSTQAMLLNLLRELLDERRIGYLLITHDLATVSFLADRILVLQHGRMVELADAATLIAAPEAEYTRALLAASPALGGSAGVVSGRTRPDA